MGRGQTGINAAIGAVITIGFSFTGFSPLLGGGVAGYLQGESPRRGVTVGATSGGIAILPIVLLIVLAFGLVAGGPGHLGSMPGGFELGIIAFLMVPILVGWIIVLSAVGGYLGAYIRRESV